MLMPRGFLGWTSDQPSPIASCDVADSDLVPLTSDWVLGKALNSL
jgi:hypothetical protein